MLQIWKSNIVATQNVAEKKEPTNLMFAEPKKTLSETLAEHIVLTCHNHRLENIYFKKKFVKFW